MNLSESNPPKLSWSWPFDRKDWIAAGVAWFVSQVVYCLTTQPNVGLLD